MAKIPFQKASATPLLSGQVVAAFGRRFQVELEQGEALSCVVRGKKTGFACGDHVALRQTEAGHGIIERVLERASLLYRSDGFRDKIIAANVTQIVIVVAAVPSFYEELINRCVVAAEASGIKAIIVLNKCDLTIETRRALGTLQLYEDIGYPVLPLSALQDATPLLPHLRGQTSVLVGQSGMGKSSIINALLPDAKSRIGEISEALDSGRHTTTYSMLYHLDQTSHLIDSPGLQEFGLSHLSAHQVDHAFIEFRPYLGHCRFNDCKHVIEPGCAVLGAMAEGVVSARRVGAYHRIIAQIKS